MMKIREIPLDLINGEECIGLLLPSHGKLRCSNHPKERAWAEPDPFFTDTCIGHSAIALGLFYSPTLMQKGGGGYASLHRRLRKVSVCCKRGIESQHPLKISDSPSNHGIFMSRSVETHHPPVKTER